VACHLSTGGNRVSLLLFSGLFGTRRQAARRRPGGGRGTQERIPGGARVRLLVVSPPHCTRATGTVRGQDRTSLVLRGSEKLDPNGLS
jgi:hypothetical protein